MSNLFKGCLGCLGMKYVQERLGHGSIAITADVYAHVSKKIESGNLQIAVTMIRRFLILLSSDMSISSIGIFSCNDISNKPFISAAPFSIYYKKRLSLY
ncbi:hypothetical protein AWH49_18540 [Domibacillus aminovorans]|uniref:Tyr recombinase domain-containing protein n=1 Tax=Domibacillus aminovorans TaxID=29332 RepID=A0A177L1P9_9BACI|nr:hypothetical protein AWH49_18540 [Domibacillus aminovorans]